MILSSILCSPQNIQGSSSGLIRRGDTDNCFTRAEAPGEAFVVVFKFLDGCHRETEVSSAQSINKIPNNENCSTAGQTPSEVKVLIIRGFQFMIM